LRGSIVADSSRFVAMGDRQARGFFSAIQEGFLFLLRQNFTTSECAEYWSAAAVVEVVCSYLFGFFLTPREVRIAETGGFL
jgi:hypothetical protein